MKLTAWNSAKQIAFELKCAASCTLAATMATYAAIAGNY